MSMAHLVLVLMIECPSVSFHSFFLSLVFLILQGDITYNVIVGALDIFTLLHVANVLTQFLNCSF